MKKQKDEYLTLCTAPRNNHGRFAQNNHKILHWLSTKQNLEPLLFFKMQKASLLAQVWLVGWPLQQTSIFQVRALLAHMLAWIYHWLNHWVRMWVERRRTNALSEIRYKPKMVSSLGSYLVAIEVLFQPPLSKSLLCNGQEPAVLLNFDDVAIICEQLEMSLFVLAPWHWCIVDAIGTSATLLAHYQRQQVLLIGMLFQTRD